MGIWLEYHWNNVGKNIKPPMIGYGKQTTYKDCDDWEMVHENVLAAL